MYNGILMTHGYLRWVVLLLAVVTIFRAYSGWKGNKPFADTDNKLGTFLIASLHLQVVLGIILFFVSPMVQQAMSNMGESMKDPLLRLRMLEHPLTMVIAVTIAQVGRIKSKKAATDMDKHKKAFVFFTIALVLILARIPW